MKKFKGTQGEWKLSSTRLNYDFKTVTKSDLDVIAIDVIGHGGHIMTFGDKNKEHIANAKLIAAAPELLKALQVCYASLCTYGGHPIIEKQAEKAINKAL